MLLIACGFQNLIYSCICRLLSWFKDLSASLNKPHRGENLPMPVQEVHSSPLEVQNINGKEMYIMSDDFVDSLLRCGLYIAAVFQLLCVAAAVVLPDKVVDPSITYYKEYDYSEDEGSDQSTPQATPRRPHAHHRPRKQEKKKRR